jgi:pyruvate/2-oxoglutarate dehydrogenase complex dihydrolipoamide acyltransferase (E2) component
VEGVVIVDKTMIFSLTYDHRIMDGVGAVKFQPRIRELMENPLEVLV